MHDFKSSDWFLTSNGGQPTSLSRKRVSSMYPDSYLTGEELSNRLIGASQTIWYTGLPQANAVRGYSKEGWPLRLSLLLAKCIDSQSSHVPWVAVPLNPRALDIEGAEDFDNVHYHVSNIQQYEGQQVTVLGGRDSAVDWALADRLLNWSFTVGTTSVRLEHRCRTQAIFCQHQTPFVPNRLIGENGHTHLEITKSNPLKPNLSRLITYLSAMALNLQSETWRIGCRIATP